MSALTVAMLWKTRDLARPPSSQSSVAILAAAALWVIASGKPDWIPGGFASNGYGANSPGGYSLLACFVAEFLLTAFFLLVVNIVYAFFDTFGVIHNVTQGGPAKATEILVYKVWYDGIVGLDLGGSAAQSVVLMAIVITLTAIQFRFIERRVHYA